MSALRETSGRRLSVLDEVLRVQARYRAWRRLRRAGLAGALLLLTVLVSLWAGPASPPAHKVWPGSTLVESVPVGAEPHAAPCAVPVPSASPASRCGPGSVPPPEPTASWRAAPRSRG